VAATWPVVEAELQGVLKELVKLHAAVSDIYTSFYLSIYIYIYTYIHIQIDR